MHKILFLLALAAVLAVPAVGTAATSPPPKPYVSCGQTCVGGGTGATGCWTEEFESTRGIDYFDYAHHYIFVDFCEFQGVIMSESLHNHGCDATGLVTCSVGPAFFVGGGVGYTWATFEAHAQITASPTKWLWTVSDVISGYVSR